MYGHARANQQKPSEIAAKESIIRVRLNPLLGSKRLDAISTEHVQSLKKHLATRKLKTVNNALTVLSTLPTKAVEWGVIDRMPCTIRLLPVPKPSARFHDFADYEHLVTASRDLCWNRQGSLTRGDIVETGRERSEKVLS